MKFVVTSEMLLHWSILLTCLGPLLVASTLWKLSFPVMCEENKMIILKRCLGLQFKVMGICFIFRVQVYFCLFFSISLNPHGVWYHMNSCPVALAGRLFQNLARTAPLFPDYSGFAWFATRLFCVFGLVCIGTPLSQGELSFISSINSISSNCLYPFPLEMDL